MKTMTTKTVWSAFVALVGALVVQGALASTTIYYHNDLAGSPIAATNASGQVIWRESYRPYGERLTNSAASKDNDVWFTSRRQDAETGLVYMGARFYDPVVGRFVSTDPKGFNDENIHTFNRYAYANNNPYRYTDPDGRNPILIAMGVGALINGGLNAAVQYYSTGTIQWGGLGGVIDAAGDGMLLGLGGVRGGSSSALRRESAEQLADEAIIVRGGTKELPGSGETFSGAVGRSLEEAAQGVPHGTIRATTVGEIRSAGGTVQRAPELTRTGVMNEKHVNICQGSGPCAFGPPQPNPVPKVERVQ